MGKRRSAEFVAAWQEASSPEEVAAKFGVKVSSACMRAAAYRKRGIPLKIMKPGPKKGSPGPVLKVAELAELARRLAPPS